MRCVCSTSLPGMMVVTWCVSGPSRKATLSLICLAEASQPDLTSPAYLCPSHVPLPSPFTILSRNTFYYLTTCPQITPSTLRLPCVLPCVLRPRLVTPASHVILRSPAFPHVLLHSPAFSCVTLHLCLASSAVLSSLERSIGSPDRNKSIPLPVSIFPCVPIIRSLFHDPLNPSILPPVPHVQFRGDFVSGLSKSSSHFLPPFSVSLHIRSSVIPSSLLLPSAVSAVVSWSSPPFIALKAVVCFSFPPSSPNCSYQVPSWRTRFHI